MTCSDTDRSLLEEHGAVIDAGRPARNQAAHDDGRLAVIVTDCAGCISEWNAEAERILGWTAAEVRGRPFASIMAPRENVDDPAAARQYCRKDGTMFRGGSESVPLRAADGAGLGTLTVLRDGTGQRQDAQALRELGDLLGTTDDLTEMSFAAARITAETLSTSSAGYGRVSDDGLYFEMERDWTAPGIASLSGRLKVENYGSFYSELRLGETVAIDDVRLDPRTSATAAALEAISARAFVNLPLIEQGCLVAVFFVLNASPRHWSTEDIAFIRNVADRTRLAIERRRAELQLRDLAASLERQVEERTRERDHVWQASNDMLCVADLNGMFASLNPAWTATLGWSLDELLARPFHEFVHPDDRELTARAAKGLVDGTPQLSFENRYLCKDGRYRWLSWNAVPRDGKVYATVREITTEKEQAAELLRSRATLRSLFETSYQLQALLTTDGVVLDANAVAIAAIGAEPADIFGKLFWETPWFDGHPEISERIRNAVAAVAAGESAQMAFSVNLIAQAVAPNAVATGRSYDFSIRPLCDDTGRVIAIVPEAVDTTDRIEAEEKLRQSQKMEAVGQLTGGLAHDFNNLLTGISGSLELLGNRLSQGRLAEADRYITAAQGAARRAAALTHRLLAFSRQQTLDPRPTDINRLVASMEELIRRTVGPAVEIEVVGSGGLWTALVDPNQLENALLNLCINARDAMPDGGRITIETANKWFDARMAAQRDVPPGQYLSLCVTDTGTGMPPDVIARAFDPFFTTKPLGQGTGLGLSMIYGFVRQSGGQVRIYSELGAGTTMCLYLPRHFGSEAGDGADGATAEVPRGRQGETVLVIDDEPSIRMLVTEILGELGYTALEAADGAAGLRVLQSKVRIDLLVTDVGLPGGMNGRQIADAARLLRPDLKVLFITGYAENAVVGNGHLDRDMHVLTKPFSMDVLGARIRQLINSA